MPGSGTETEGRIVSGEGAFGERLPKMAVEPPGPKSVAYSRRLAEHEFPSCSVVGPGRSTVFWERAVGANVEDADGNVYVDLTSGFCVAGAGHSNPRVAQAIGKQAARMMHSQGGLNPNALRVRLAEKLAELAPGDLSSSFIANTGAEAVNIAIKTAILYTGRQTIVAFQGGFHGKTTGALHATSINYYREPFLSCVGRSTHIPYGYCYRCAYGAEYPGCGLRCAEYLDYVLSNPDSGVADVAALIVEPVQGHGGWIVPPREFMGRLREICDRHAVLLIADEIITGLGRVGYTFGVDHSDVVPDIITVGKGLASGFPISAAIARADIAQAWKPMQHSSTFVGNPVGCAGALASIEEIESRGLIQRSRELGERFTNALRAMQERHPLMGDVRGLGMMVGVEFVRDRATREPAGEQGSRVVKRLLGKGVMATNYGGTWHNVLKMSPPLVITEGQLDCALGIMDESIGEVEAEGDSLESTGSGATSSPVGA